MPYPANMSLKPDQGGLLLGVKSLSTPPRRRCPLKKRPVMAFSPTSTRRHQISVRGILHCQIAAALKEKVPNRTSLLKLLQIASPGLEDHDLDQERKRRRALTSLKLLLDRVRRNHPEDKREESSILKNHSPPSRFDTPSLPSISQIQAFYDDACRTLPALVPPVSSPKDIRQTRWVQPDRDFEEEDVAAYQDTFSPRERQCISASSSSSSSSLSSSVPEFLPTTSVRPSASLARPQLSRVVSYFPPQFHIQDTTSENSSPTHLLNKQKDMSEQEKSILLVLHCINLNGTRANGGRQAPSVFPQIDVRELQNKYNPQSIDQVFDALEKRKRSRSISCDSFGGASYRILDTVDSVKRHLMTQGPVVLDHSRHSNKNHPRVTPALILGWNDDDNVWLARTYCCGDQVTHISMAGVCGNMIASNLSNMDLLQGAWLQDGTKAFDTDLSGLGSKDLDSRSALDLYLGARQIPYLFKAIGCTASIRHAILSKSSFFLRDSNCKTRGRWAYIHDMTWQEHALGETGLWKVHCIFCD